MRRILLLPAMLLIAAACGTGGGEAEGATTEPDPTATLAPATTSASSTTTTGSGFPVTVEADNGPITIDEAPGSIVSLSSTATEMLFAIGAGPQVVAVDEQSNYPQDAPVTDLSGFTPNVEAILSHEPDLVVVGYEPGDLVDSLTAAGVPVIYYNAAMSLEGTYAQIEGLGAVTGRVDEAAQVNEMIESGIEQAITDAPDLPEGTSYYHEVDNTLYTATSSTFIGQIYAMFGLENIADPADEDGSAAGFPQLSSEYVVSADPDLIFLANTLYGESAETVAERPGWAVLSAVQDGHVFELDSDIVSRWGPRVVEFAETVSQSLVMYAGES